MRVEIRRIREGEGDQLMRIRLMSLLDAPYAFESTYIDSLQRPADDWQERAVRAARGETEAIFVAETDTGWIGLIGVFTPENERRRHLWGMWVDPPIRSQGVGGALLETAVEWASLLKTEAVTLWVANTNLPALRLYEKAGFVRDGMEKPMPGQETIIEVRMVRLLASSVEPRSVRRPRPAGREPSA